MRVIGLKSTIIGSSEKFYKNFMLKLESVLITDMFNGNEIRSIKTKNDAIKLWQNMLIPLDDEYDNAINIMQITKQLKERQKPDIFNDPNVSDQILTYKGGLKFSDYFSFLKKNNHQMYTRVNFDVPEFIKSKFTIPTVCSSLESEERLIKTKILFGCNGSFSQTHFDKDGMHGLLYQVYGRKRFIIFPYASSEKMAPFTQFSGWFVQNFSSEDCKKFLEYTGGFEVLLEPGDAIYIPPFCWHYADYLSDCCSINIRFRCDKRIATLLNKFFPDRYLQGISHKILTSPFGTEIYDKIICNLNNLENNFKGDDDKLFNAKRNLLKEIFSEIFPNIKGAYTFDLEEYFPSPLPDLLFRS